MQMSGAGNSGALYERSCSTIATSPPQLAAVHLRATDLATLRDPSPPLRQPIT